MTVGSLGLLEKLKKEFNQKNNDGDGGKPSGDEGGDDEDNKILKNIFMVLVGLFGFIGVVYLLTREKGEEISYQQFQNHLLANGYVDHLEVINKRTVRVYTRPQGLYFPPFPPLFCPRVFSSHTNFFVQAWLFHKA